MTPWEAEALTKVADCAGRIIEILPGLVLCATVCFVFRCLTIWKQGQ